jgi:hypothetical protein
LAKLGLEDIRIVEVPFNLRISLTRWETQTSYDSFIAFVSTNLLVNGRYGSGKVNTINFLTGYFIQDILNWHKVASLSDSDAQAP